MTKQQVHSILVDHIALQLRDEDRNISVTELSDDCDLLMAGLIDSLGFLELTAALDEHCGFELDFENLDPERMTVVGPLCDFVVAQAAGRQ